MIILDDHGNLFDDRRKGDRRKADRRKKPSDPAHDRRKGERRNLSKNNKHVVSDPDEVQMLNEDKKEEEKKD